MKLKGSLRELFLYNLICWKIMSEWQVLPIKKSKVQKNGCILQLISVFYSLIILFLYTLKVTILPFVYGRTESEFKEAGYFILQQVQGKAEV